MDLQIYKKRLLAREQELVEESTRFDAEGRDSRTSEVEDPVDVVTSNESKATNFQLGDLAARNLQQVRAALQRVDEGTYGFCIECGRAIDSARLDAVPWTPYCREDQERHEQSDAASEDADVIPTA